MKSKHIEKSNDKTAKKVQEIEIQSKIQASSTIEERGQENSEQNIALGGLRLMLEQLVSYFQHCANSDDNDTLIFGLCHLFSHVDTLYCETLPALTTITHTRATSATMKTRIIFRYALWTHLQQMQQHIERIESLCHLLNRTLPRLLSVLDSSDTIYRPNDSMQDDTKRWQQAYELLTGRLNAWQEHNEQRLTFASSVMQHASDSASVASVNSSSEHVSDTTRDSSFTTMRPLLTRIDASLILVLDSAGAMYGDIIPDFQSVSHGDDEVVATLLFDLMQQADLLLIQCDTLLGPLQDLIRHYMLSE